MMIPHLSTAAIGAPITRLGVSFFPIYLPANELPEIKTGPSSELDVRELEDAAVDSLLAVNPTDTPVLIVEGEHFLGGKQNRAVNITVLVPPRTELKIPVSCLEEGTVGPRRVLLPRRCVRVAASPQKESRGRSLVPWSKANRTAAIKERSGTRSITRCDRTRRTPTPSQPPTAPSMSIVTIQTALRRPKSCADLGPLPRQCGIAVSHGPWVTAVELFGARHLLAEHWGALIRSHLLELPPEFRPPSVERALWVLRRFGAMQPQESPSVGLGFELRVRDQKRIGQALTLDGMLAHGSFWMRNGRRI